MELKEVFEPVLNIVKNFQKKDKEPASKQAAKDRLKLVLMQDRASVSPDFFDLMKKELIDVIKKYIEIDEESLDVQLTRGMEVGLEGPALYANIPIKNVKPVAPQGENGEESIMTEEQADEVAEEILNQIEEAAKIKAEAEAVQKEEAISDLASQTAQKIEEEAKNIAEEIKAETKLDELHRFANEGVQAVREELNLTKEHDQPLEEEDSKEKTSIEDKEPKVTTKKKTTSRKTTSKKKKEE